MTTAAPSDIFSTTALASLFVAGLSLGAVYAFNHTRLGQLRWPGAAAEDTPSQGADEDEVKTSAATSASASVTTTTTARKSQRRKKGTGKGTAGVGEREGNAEGEGLVGQSLSGGGTTASFARVVPGDLAGVGVDFGSSEASPAGGPSKPTPSAKTQKKKKQRTKKQKQKLDKDADENQEAGSETDREGSPVVRSGDSTDASVSVSRYPSAAGDAPPGSSRAVTRGSVGTSTRLAPPSHSREARPSLSFDTDSSWTHVDRRRAKSSQDEDGSRGLADAMDVTSSDVASTASDSPVVERMDFTTRRADPDQRTLAEKLVPRPKKTNVDDMLERPDVPTLARVMRVQPPADETPVPGFSWEDYGDVVEDSVLFHDADEEDEGEWGVVKGRHRSRHPQTTATPMSTSHTPSAPETMTKKQRQNARKRELAKSAKTEAEAARLEGLAKHKRELERLRIIEQSQQGGGKGPSGGMHATVDDRGKLVWE